MIFLSHTHADKPLVDPIANKLSQVFGRQNVFYDSWSIQPGDGIIDKMSEALSGCRFFFFFVSKNSLQSNMVKLEWQNAVLKATKGETRIIPVKLDDCLMPGVLLQTLYIDFFGQGPENALRQMVDVISGRSIYRSGVYEGYHNLRAYVKEASGVHTIEFRAESYMEPHSRYLIILDNTEEDVSWTALGESMFESKFVTGAKLNDGKVVNCLLIARQAPTTPGFPFVVELKPKRIAAVSIRGAMHAVSRDQFSSIPVIGAK